MSEKKLMTPKEEKDKKHQISKPIVEKPTNQEETEKSTEESYLKRAIQRKLNQIYGTEYSEKDLSSITDMLFEYKLVNGKASNISLRDAVQFKNLKTLTLRGYRITKEDLEYIFKNLKLENISFMECSFDDIDFDTIDCIPTSMAFISCKSMPNKLPRLKYINIFASNTDFRKIDFSEAIKVDIRNSRIANAQDLDKYEKIEITNFNGSEFYGADGTVISDIKVPEGCTYTHLPRAIYKVDNGQERF